MGPLYDAKSNRQNIFFGITHHQQFDEDRRRNTEETPFHIVTTHLHCDDTTIHYTVTTLHYSTLQYTVTAQHCEDCTLHFDAL